MSDHSTTLPDPPPGWQPDHSMCSNMTDYKGVHYSKKPYKGALYHNRVGVDYDQLWRQFITKSDEYKEWAKQVYVPGNYDTAPDLAGHNERILKEKEDSV